MEPTGIFGIYQDEYDNLRKTFRVKVKVTREQIKEYPVLKGTKEIEADPVPKNSEEAFNLLTKYYAAIQCVVCKDRALRAHKVWNRYTLEEEKYRLKKFIDKASEQPQFEFLIPHPFGPQAEGETQIYRKFLNGYYRHSELSELAAHDNAKQAKVYGEYFLYYEWIKSELRLLNNSEEQKNTIEKQSGKKAADQNLPETFDELFNEEYRIKIPECIRLLQEASPSIVNSNLVYTGKTKGEVIIWFRALDARSFIISPKPNDEIIIKLLEKKFQGFTSDASAFRKPQKRSENKYLEKFRAALLRIQKGMS